MENNNSAGRNDNNRDISPSPAKKYSLLKKHKKTFSFSRTGESFSTPPPGRDKTPTPGDRRPSIDLGSKRLPPELPPPPQPQIPLPILPSTPPPNVTISGNTQQSPHPFTVKIINADLKKYDVKKVIKCQTRIRGWLARRTLRQISNFCGDFYGD